MIAASIACVALVAHFEGFCSSPYLCPAGVPTIGFGATFYEDGRRVTMQDQAISRERAEKLLSWHLSQFGAMLDKAVTVKTEQRERDALLSILFNVGPGSTGKRDGIIWLANGQPSTLLRRLNAGDKQGAADAFLSWNRSGGKALPGLTKRRAAERALFLGLPYSLD